MKKFPIRPCDFLVLILFVLFTRGIAIAQVTLCSWNIQNFGKSKSAEEIEFIANTLKGFDIVAIQEVVAGNGGAQAVARLADELNRKGTKWDYIISDPTKSSPYCTERYAFLWKTSKVRNVDRSWLEQEFESEIDREPFYIEFKHKNEIFTLVNFHAIPRNKQPEKEIKYFKFLPAQYSGKKLIFLGDFNLPQTHTVFNPLKKMKYSPVLVGQKTSLKMKRNKGESLASEYDNIFYKHSEVRVISCGVIHFYEQFYSLKEARMISDHVPVWMEFEIISQSPNKANKNVTE